MRSRLPLVEALPKDALLVAICGNNHTLERNLRALIHTPRLQVLGFTNRMSDYMDAADLFITKPGGLSTTEAATKGVPLVLFNAVPGCETRNLEFLLSIGCAVSENGALSLASRSISSSVCGSKPLTGGMSSGDGMYSMTASSIG